METTVVNLHHSEYDVYIGRGRGSIYGNPFSWLPGTPAEFKTNTRKQAIARFRSWVVTQDEIMNNLEDLRGLRLGCFCKPKACHGDVYIELLQLSPEASNWASLRTAETVLLEQYLRSRGAVRVRAYRFNSASIRVCVVDERFRGFSHAQRCCVYEMIEAGAPAQTRADIIKLYLFHPGEWVANSAARIQQLEFNKAVCLDAYGNVQE